jgi:hypothetical protein
VNGRLKTAMRPIASLRLTVPLLAAAMLLVYFGTIAQSEHDILAVQRDFFRCFVIWSSGLTIFPGYRLGFPFPIPVPGGYVIGGLMLVNLVAAHAVRFKLTWKRAGIIAIHAGIILILLGELFTGLFAVEMQMAIKEGETVNVAQDVRHPELVIIDPSGKSKDRLVAVPAPLLKPGSVIDDPRLPFEVRVERYYRNSRVVGPMEPLAKKVERLATAGPNANHLVAELPDELSIETVNFPSAFISLRKGGENLGTWLVSIYLDAQDVVVDGKTYRIALDFRKYYKPYSVTLVDFDHERYPGSDIARQYTSRVVLNDPGQKEQREALIYMNHPLRYGGETFYQAGAPQPDVTVLQIVDNPAALLPYISCLLVGGGLLLHFIPKLAGFLKARRA